MQSKLHQLKTLLDELVSTVCNNTIVGYLERDDKLILVMNQVPELLQEAWSQLCKAPPQTFERAMFHDGRKSESAVAQQQENYPDPSSLVKVMTCIPELREEAWNLLHYRCTKNPGKGINNVAFGCLKEQLVEFMKAFPGFRIKIWGILPAIFKRLLVHKSTRLANMSTIVDCCISIMVHCPECVQEAWETIVQFKDGESFLKVMKLVPNFQHLAWEKLLFLKDEENRDYYLKEVAEEFPEFREKANRLRVQLHPIIQKMVALSQESG